MTEIQPGKLSIIQEKPKEPDAISGKLFDLTTRINYDSLEVVWLTTRTGRVYFPYRGGRASAPECFSDDGVRPSTAAVRQQNDTCLGCPMNQWAGGQFPQCKDDWRMLLVIRETGLPRWLRPGPGSTKMLKAMRQRVADDNFVSMNAGKGERHLWDYGFTISLRKVKKGRWWFWEPMFTDWRLLDKIALEDGSKAGPYDKAYEEYVKKPSEKEREILASVEAKASPEEELFEDIQI